MSTTQEDLGYETAPRYSHSCRNCMFLGQQDEYDLYLCLSTRESTVIARFGKEGEYASGMSFAFGANRHLTVARRRAQTRGLLKYPLKEAIHRVTNAVGEDLRAELKEALSKCPEAQAMQMMATGVADGARQLAVLSEAQALEYKADFPDMELSDLRGWVQSHLEQMRMQLVAFGLPAPDFFAVYQAVRFWEEQVAPAAAA